MGPWRFDPLSAAIGAVLALIATGLFLHLRGSLIRGWERAVAEARRLSARITASAEQRYREHVAAWAVRRGSLSHLAPLDRVFVPPGLIPPPAHPHPEAGPSVGRVSLPLGAALSGHPRLVVIGDLGSGRSALLAYLALVYARREAGTTLGLPLERLPIYLYLPDMDWEPPPEPAPGERPRPPRDEHEWLIEHALAAVGGKKAHAAALRQSLTTGTALVLADGWDEIGDAAQRERASTWLGRLADELPGNLWIVTASARGFNPLQEAGFTYLRLEEWEPSQGQALRVHWASLFPPAEGEPAADLRPLDAALNAALNRGATPLELTLRCGLFFARRELPAGRGELFARVADWLLEPPPAKEPLWEAPAARAALERLAFAALQEGRMTFSRQEVLEGLQAVLPVAEGQAPRLAERLLQALLAPGNLLCSRAADRFAFVHPLWQAALAASQALSLSPEAVAEHVEEPQWQPVLDFYAERGAMEPVLRAWLAQADDLWHTRLRRAARWAALAPAGAQWRNGVMALLARSLFNPALRLPIRRGLAWALTQTGDPGVAFFFKQALSHKMTDLQVVAAEGLGRLGREADVATLEMALGEAEPRLQAAIVAALGAMGSRAAVRLLARILMEADQELRVQAARALARCGEEGTEVLRQAAKDEDLLTRRAAVYGLAEVTQPWARTLLIEIARDDVEWIVRSAADTALETEGATLPSVEPPLQVSETGWLIAWAAQRGEPLGRGPAALEMLLRATTEGSPPVRRAAVQALGLVGGPEHVAVLRRLLEDEDPEVAAVALEALAELARRHDLKSLSE